jgi:hypothetical protein
MACYQPIPAHQNGPGERVILWPSPGLENLAVPCGKCIGCRTIRATHWANRCSHEATLYTANSFLTLTYDDEHLPKNRHLRPEHLTRFLKRVRRRAANRDPRLDTDIRHGVRFLACGEYGERTGRPHYHVLLFNCNFTDRQRAGGTELWRSRTLNDLWSEGTTQFGECRIGDLTPASANYVAQYSLKKQGNGDHDQDGVYRPPPFMRMSLKPAIGSQWLHKYYLDLEKGFITVDGRKQTIPRAYLQKLKTIDPSLYDLISYKKHKHMEANPTDKNTPIRLADAEAIHQRRKQLTEERTL